MGLPSASQAQDVLMVAFQRLPTGLKSEPGTHFLLGLKAEGEEEDL